MSVFFVIILILTALFLLIIEFFIVPGISIAGIASIVFFSAGIILAYKYFGNFWGNVTLILTIFFIVVTLVKALQSKTWNKLSLKSEINSQSKNESDFSNIKIGDKGIAKSKLSPIGEIIINNCTFEAESIGVFIDAGQPIEIVKIERTKIYVKPLI